MAPFGGKGTKFKIPSEIKPPLATVLVFGISETDEDAGFPVAGADFSAASPAGSTPSAVGAVSVVTSAA